MDGGEGVAAAGAEDSTGPASPGSSSEEDETPQSTPRDKVLRYWVDGRGVREATLREAARFSIFAEDDRGKRVATARMAFTIAIRGVARVRAHFVRGEDPNVYTVEWHPPNSGRYVISVSKEGVTLPGSPFHVVAMTPEPFSAQCLVRGKALHRAVARDPQEFQVHFRDRLSAITHAVELDVFVEPVSDGSPRGRLEDHAGKPSEMSTTQARPQLQPRSAPAKKNARRQSMAPALKVRDLWAKPPEPVVEEKPKPDEDEDLLLGALNRRSSCPTTISPVHLGVGTGRGTETRYRKLRVRVLDKPLIVRSDFDLRSDQLGQLLPGAVVTVIEERVDHATSTVRACIALDGIEKQDADGTLAKNGLTFRSSVTSSTYRSSDTAATPGKTVSQRLHNLDQALVLAHLSSAPGLRGDRGGKNSRRNSLAKPTAVVATALPGALEQSLEVIPFDALDEMAKEAADEQMALAVREAADITDAAGTSKGVAEAAGAGSIQHEPLDIVEEVDEVVLETLQPEALPVAPPVAPPDAPPEAPPEAPPRPPPLETPSPVRVGRRGSVVLVDHNTPPPIPNAMDPASSASPNMFSTPQRRSPQVQVISASPLVLGALGQLPVAAEKQHGAAHSKIRKRIPLKLSTDLAVKGRDMPTLSADQLKTPASNRKEKKSHLPEYMQLPSQRSHRGSGGGGQASHRKAEEAKLAALQIRRRSLAEHGIVGDQASALVADTGRTEGWVTLMKNGDKFVTSRLRLDVQQRAVHQQQWARRALNHKLTEEEKNGRQNPEDPRSKKDYSIRSEKGPSLSREVALELESDPNSFAFGGLFPGTLHSHGQLRDAHKVSYSIGVSGKYLLHVRLRKQAIGLPGSPFLLEVEPGPAFALSSSMPFEPLSSEVGHPITHVMRTADRIGNQCVKGGALVECTCGKSESTSKDISVETKDMGDGSYQITWASTKPGEFFVNIKVDGDHVVNSPSHVRFFSTIPVFDMSSVVEGTGLHSAVVGEQSIIVFSLADKYGNEAVPDQEYRDMLRMYICFVKQSQLTGSEENDLDEACNAAIEADGVWLSPTGGDYELRYTPVASNQGFTDLLVWCDPNGEGERISMPGTPFKLSISASLDQIVSNDVDTTGATAGDYRVMRSVFEEAQERWGVCTLDAFASEPTALVDRFWTASKCDMAVGVDALAMPWNDDERIWAHPPPNLLPALAALLRDKARQSEVIVCAPFWPSTEWFRDIMYLSNDKRKYRAGKLQKLPGVNDAPGRLTSWPIMIFHIPAPFGDGKARLGEREKRAERRGSTFELIAMNQGSRSTSPQSRRPSLTGSPSRSPETRRPDSAGGGVAATAVAETAAAPSPSEEPPVPVESETTPGLFVVPTLHIS